MIRLANDNAIELLKDQGKTATFRSANDDEEFFSLLKEKLLIDIERMSKEDNPDKKLDYLIDAYLDIREFMRYMEKGGVKVSDAVEKRKNKLGSFNKRIVIESLASLPYDYADEAKEILDYGEKNGFPPMVLGRNESNKPFMVMSRGGRNLWIDKTESRNMKAPYNEGFKQLLDAVRRGDIYEEQS